MSGADDTELRAQLAHLLGVVPDVGVLPFSARLSLSAEAVRARALTLAVPEGKRPVDVIGDAALNELLSGLSPAPVMPDGTVRPGVSIARGVRATADGGLEAYADGWVPLALEVGA